MKKLLITATILAASVIGVQAETIKTRVGPLEFTQSFTEGYPTDETASKLLQLSVVFSFSTPYFKISGLYD